MEGKIHQLIILNTLSTAAECSANNPQKQWLGIWQPIATRITLEWTVEIRAKLFVLLASEWKERYTS